MPDAGNGKWFHVLTGSQAMAMAEWVPRPGMGPGRNAASDGLGVGPLSKYLRIVQKSRKNFCCLRTK